MAQRGYSFGFSLFLVCALEVGAQPRVWSGHDTAFSKPAFADWTLPEHQDRITADVWITRADQQGIFNIAQESSYQGMGLLGPSPVGTLWALGNASDWATLTFTTWAVLADRNPPHLIGLDAVVHLVNEDIYMDIRFTEWGGAAGGGAFAYLRAAGPACRADLSGSSDPSDPDYGQPDGAVDASDFFYFLDQFVAGNLAVADMSGSSDPNDPAYGVPDGQIDIADFFYYLDLFVQGCP